MKHCKAVSQSHVSQSHEAGRVGETSWKYLQTHSGHGFRIIEGEEISKYISRREI